MFFAKARSGNNITQWELGNCFEHGAKTKSGDILSTEKGCKNFEEAIFWSKKAIENGSATAAYNLATIYRNLEKPKLSFKYYQKAVDMGDKDSLLEVGLSYLFGYGTEKNYILAQKTIQKIQKYQPVEITQRTKENSLYWLGLIKLLNLTEQKQSLKEIRRLFEKANQDNDHEQANEVLNFIGKSIYLKA